MQYPITFDQYQQGLEEGKFPGLHCNACDAYTFPPQGVCQKCGSQDLEVTEVKGQGTLKTFTVIRVAPEGMTPPYLVGLVELDEGPWAMGNVVGLNPDEATMELIGKRVTFGTQVVKGDVYSGDDRLVLTFSPVTG